MFAFLFTIAVCFTTTAKMENQRLLESNSALRAALAAISQESALGSDWVLSVHDGCINTGKVFAKGGYDVSTPEKIEKICQQHAVTSNSCSCSNPESWPTRDCLKSCDCCNSDALYRMMENRFPTWSKIEPFHMARAGACVGLSLNNCYHKGRQHCDHFKNRCKYVAVGRDQAIRNAYGYYLYESSAARYIATNSHWNMYLNSRNTKPTTD